MKFYENHGNYVKLFDGKQSELEINSPEDKGHNLVQVKFVDKRERNRHQNWPSKFLADKKLGETAIENNGKERVVNLTNRDNMFDDYASGSYGAKVNGKNITVKQYELKFSKATANKEGFTPKEFASRLLTERLYVLSNNPDERRVAPIKGTKCIMYYRPKEENGEIITEEEFLNENNTAYVIIEITRNHHAEKPNGNPMAFGDYIEPTNPLQYTANTHPGLITVLSTDDGRFAGFQADDWNREDIPAAPQAHPTFCPDPFYESAHYKILAIGAIYERKNKPNFKLRIDASDNYNDDWLAWLYSKVRNNFRHTFHTCDRGDGTNPEDYLQFTLNDICEGDKIYLSIDGDHTWNQIFPDDTKDADPWDEINSYFQIQSSPGKKWMLNYDKPIWPASPKGTPAKGEPDTDIKLTWQISGWLEDDDDLKKLQKAVFNPFLDLKEIGESYQEIVELRWFLRHSIAELKAMTKSVFKEKCPNLNLREELLTVGDSGDMVVAIHEQLQNVGLNVQDRNLFTANSYNHIISFKKYLRKLDQEFYDYLHIGDPCGTPPDCLCGLNQCSCSTEYSDCKSNSGNPCGCVSYGTYTFIMKYEQQPRPTFSTLRWKDMLESNGMESAFSDCKPIGLVYHESNHTIDVKPTECFKLKVRNGWEVKLLVTAYDSSGDQITDNFNGVGALYLWLKGNDELMFNSHDAKGKGWPYQRQDGSAIPSPIYHLVATVNNDVENDPNGNPYTTNQTAMPPLDMPQGSDEENVITGVPIIMPSNNNRVTFRIKLVDVRAPFREWSIFEDTMPSGWGLEYGASAITKFTRDMAQSFSATGSIEVGIYTGLKMQLLLLFNLEAGLFTRYKYDGEHTIMFGYSGSAKIGLGGTSVKWKGKQTYPYKLDGNLIVSDIGEALIHLLHRLMMQRHPDSEGLEVFGYDFTRISSQQLPRVTENKFEMEIANVKTEGVWETKNFGQGEKNTEISISVSKNNHKVSVAVKDMYDRSGVPKDATLEVKIGWNTDGGTVKNMMDAFTENDVFNFSAIDKTTKPGEDILFWVNLLEGNKEFDPGNIIPLVTNKRLFKWGVEVGFNISFTNIPKKQLDTLIPILLGAPSLALFDEGGLATILWLSQHIGVPNFDEINMNLGLYSEITAEVSKSWPFANLAGILTFYLVLKADAAAKLSVDMDISSFMRALTKGIGPMATTALVCSLTKGPLSIPPEPKPNLIQTMLLLEMPSSVAIDSHGEEGGKLRLNLSGPLDSFAVGNKIAIRGASNSAYNLDNITITSLVNTAQDRHVVLDRAKANVPLNWSSGRMYKEG